MAVKTLSVVIPTFNEADNIKRLIEEIDAALQNVPYEIIFVDDSTDSTPRLLAEAAGLDSRIRFEHRENGSGLATAVLRGFELARGDYIAVMDADLQHPPIALRYMYCAMRRGADICVPSRFIPGGSDGGLDFFRKFVSWTARYMGKILLRSLRRI
ncbi:MAG: glycosyltransferase, partial [Butyrivibrio sp.]|nr:glycosyltransferase [Butyrivibrio sp.]